METADWIMVGGIIAILGFLYRLQDRVGTLDQQMSRLAERVARIEGILTGHPVSPHEPAE